jgi:hypothetical protein
MTALIPFGFIIISIGIVACIGESKRGQAVVEKLVKLMEVER